MAENAGKPSTPALSPGKAALLFYNIGSIAQKRPKRYPKNRVCGHFCCCLPCVCLMRVKPPSPGQGGLTQNLVGIYFWGAHVGPAPTPGKKGRNPIHCWENLARQGFSTSKAFGLQGVLNIFHRVFHNQQTKKETQLLAGQRRPALGQKRIFLQEMAYPPLFCRISTPVAGKTRPVS